MIANEKIPLRYYIPELCLRFTIIPNFKQNLAALEYFLLNLTKFCKLLSRFFYFCCHFHSFILNQPIYGLWIKLRIKKMAKLTSSCTALEVHSSIHRCFRLTVEAGALVWFLQRTSQFQYPPNLRVYIYSISYPWRKISSSSASAAPSEHPLLHFIILVFFNRTRGFAIFAHVIFKILTDIFVPTPIPQNFVFIPRLSFAGSFPLGSTYFGLQGGYVF